MSSTFAGVSLFDSGPHRFAVRAVGRYLTFPFEGGGGGGTIEIFGERGLVIEQTGRLVAPSDAALWVLIDAVRSRAEGPTLGTLVDHHGRVWPSMSMVELRTEDRIDRGRVVSIGYRVLYVGV
ncbi:MAG: hypothetical protein AAFX05_10475 [Planctomycetota bacterium]